MMHSKFRLSNCSYWIVFLLAVLLSVSLLSSSRGRAAAGQGSGSTTLAADAELGHLDFTTPTCDDPAVPPAAELCHPVGVGVNAQSGVLAVADGDDNRVLLWPSAANFTNGQSASVVLGQPDFTIGKKCTGSTTASTICDPNATVFDSTGHLWVADTDGDRVIRFTPPFSNDMAADMVIGQRNLTTSNCGVGPDIMCHPRDIAFDAHGNLFVVDSDNNRALIFFAPLSSSMSASLVIGQADFTSKKCNRTGNAVPGPDTLCGPKGLALDSNGNLYVAEDDNSRVMEFNNPLAQVGDITASIVYGEPNFSTVACTVGPTGVCHPDHIALGRFGQLIISDGDNNRLLVVGNPLTNTTANQVIGQPNFTSNTPTTTASGLAGPKGITVDSSGNLYSTDEDNNRLLRYNKAE